MNWISRLIFRFNFLKNFSQFSLIWLQIKSKLITQNRLILLTLRNLFPNFIESGKIILLISIISIVFINGCSITKPPLELSPSPAVIKKSLLLQLEKKHDHLSQNLKTQPLKIKVTQINISHINPFFQDNLAIYHLQGKYNLNLQLKNKQVNQINQNFDLYLQRQKEGKTWRLTLGGFGGL